MALALLLILFLQTDQKCTIEGQVANSITAAPLRKATLSLVSRDSKNRYVTISGSDGKFIFGDLEPGLYTLTAQRVGYLDADQEITLATGQDQKDLPVKLTPQGVISGRVADEDGDPVPTATIHYMLFAGTGEKKHFLETGSQFADGEGHFTFTRLKPGHYYLAVETGHEEHYARRNAKKGPEEAYMATYYPNALKLHDAIPIEVAPGAEIRNLEIRLRKAGVFRVRGKLSNVPANADRVASRLDLRLAEGDDAPLGLGSRFAQIVDGRFEFIDVLPGSYILRSLGSRQGVRSAFFCRLTVDVRDQNIDDLVVSLAPGSDIKGMIHADGLKIVKPPTISLEPKSFFEREAKAEANAEGAFLINQLPPDEFAIHIGNLPEGAYLKSIQHNGQALKNGSLDLVSGGGGSLDIFMSPNAAEIAGVLRNEKGDRAGRMMVNLWVDQDKASKSALTSADGRFEFRNLAPGGYHLTAWEDSEVLPGERDPETMFGSQSKAVTLSEGSKESVDLTLIAK